MERGRLLVAAPLLSDPNFERTVVLIVEHDVDGTVGLVLNRPSSIQAVQAVASWVVVTSLSPPAVIFGGGPVAPDVAIGLGRVRQQPPLVGDIGLVDLGREPDQPAASDEFGRSGRPVGAGGSGQTGDPVDGGDPAGRTGLGGRIAPGGEVGPDRPLRLFAGYAGWGPSQLSDELDAGAWYVVDAEESDVLSPQPSMLWRQVLRRQRSALRLLAAFPSDPSSN